VELGHTLAQKRKLTAGQVPVGLQQDLDALTPAGAAPAAPPSPDAPVSGTEKEPQEITHAP
jgi:hypothetical protein